MFWCENFNKWCSVWSCKREQCEFSEVLSMDKEEVRHFFEMEIALAEERMKLKHNPMFNGVEVGHENQIELNKAHICYCEYVMKSLCREK